MALCKPKILLNYSKFRNYPQERSKGQWVFSRQWFSSLSMKIPSRKRLTQITRKLKLQVYLWGYYWNRYTCRWNYYYGYGVDMWSTAPQNLGYLANLRYLQDLQNPVDHRYIYFIYYIIYIYYFLYL